MNPFRKVFVDTGGNYAGFKWWFRWTIAYWHWRKWLKYEGMPESIKDIDEMGRWNLQLLELQHGSERLKGKK